MEFTPKSDKANPILDGMCCQSFSTNQNHKNKKCKCIKNTHKMMVNDLRILSGGNMDNRTAIWIHKARWIGFFERLITKMQPTTQHSYEEEESLFAFLQPCVISIP